MAHPSIFKRIRSSRQLSFVKSTFSSKSNAKNLYLKKNCQFDCEFESMGLHWDENKSGDTGSLTQEWIMTNKVRNIEIYESKVYESPCNVSANSHFMIYICVSNLTPLLILTAQLIWYKIYLRKNSWKQTRCGKPFCREIAVSWMANARICWYTISFCNTQKSI